MYIQYEWGGKHFEWDSEKHASNIDKHGVRFEDAVPAINERMLTKFDTSADHGEDRWQALNHVDDNFFYIIFTMRDEITRVISARKAIPNEIENYFKPR